jgi:hypothetical protein
MIAAAHFPGENIVVVLVFVAVVITGIWGSLRQKRADRLRSLEMQELAERLKFDDFNPNRDEGFVMGWGFLSQLAQGDNGYAFNILRGTYHEQALFVFDHHYQTGSGKSREEHYGTIFMLIVKEAFPKVIVGHEREGLLAKAAAALLGGEDEIKFESAEFSRIYCVRSGDKRFAYDVCNPQMMEYLLANRDLEIEIQGPVILLAFEPQLPVDQIELNLQRLVEIRSRLPQYLFSQNA